MTVITKDVISLYLKTKLHEIADGVTREERAFIALDLFSYINRHFHSIYFYFKYSEVLLESIKMKSIEIIDDEELDMYIVLKNECQNVVEKIERMEMEIENHQNLMG